MSTVAESLSRRRVRLGNIEPAVVTLLKQLDPLIVVAALFVCQLLYRERLSSALAALALLAFSISSRLFGQLDRRERIATSSVSVIDIFSRIIIKWASVVACLLLAAFAFKVSAVFSRRMMLTWFVATPLLLTFAHVLRLRAGWFAAGASAPRYIIIGVNEVGFELARRLPSTGFHGYFDFRSADRLTSPDSKKLTGHCRDVANYVRSQGVNVVYIALPLSNVPRMSELVNALRDTTASVYFVPDAFAFDLIQGRLVEINGMPALSVCETPFHGMDAVLKRVTDITFASLGVLVTLPITLTIAAAVKLTSRGPVLFRQRRYGLHGEQIVVYKFRSMTVCEDGPQVAQARKSDPRVTRVGRFIRKTSLDELPQLLNVLEGKMSMVGPRPHAVAHNEQYRKLIDGYMIRHKVRPGITGLAQVNGLRGETETLDKMSERVRYDLEYLRNWSPWLDIQIMLKTIAIVVSGDRNNVY
jgi:putative colanic acid biosysnthesis UDP-glucose lipid carrier transferase